MQTEGQEVHLKEVEKLLKVKIVINAKVNYCYSLKALYKIAKKRYLEVIRRLLTTKVDVNANECDMLIQKTLQVAVEERDLKMVKKIFNSKYKSESQIK